MVSSKQGRTLYEGTKALIVENLDKLAKAHIVATFPVGAVDDAVKVGTQGEQLLKAFRTVWDDHTSSMSKIRDILKYMVRLVGATRFDKNFFHASSIISLRTVCTARPKRCHKYGMPVCSYSSIALLDPLYILYNNMY
jgi:hypothetical protein